MSTFALAYQIEADVLRNEMDWPVSMIDCQQYGVDVVKNEAVNDHYCSDDCWSIHYAEYWGISSSFDDDAG